MLGWKITDNGRYKLKFHKLSAEEEELISRTEKTYGEVARGGNISTRENAKEKIKEILGQECRRMKVYIDDEQEEYLLEVATSHIFGLCFFDELLEDDNIEEISAIGIEKPVYVFDRKKGWLDVNVCFESEEQMAEIVNKMAKNTGRRITLKNPRVNAMLEDGSRLHATLPPISCGEITIRKFRQNPFSPKEIVENKTCDLESMAFLSLAMQSDSNIVIAGNTASGKTTTLNSLFSFVPEEERILIIEETPEISIPHGHQIKMIPNPENEINLSDLVYDSLRMRPDRTIVGEIRKREEALAMVDAMISGQARGCYATMHARSSMEAFQRLKTFGISNEDINSIDCIIIQRRILKYDPKCRRNYQIRKIVEISAPTEGTHYIPDKRLCREKFAQKIADQLGLSKKEFQKELENRKKVINSCSLNFEKSFGKIQKEFYGIKI
ncbi:MAG: ATPase, T2SS/T4P/T4SS family [Candidatus Micrarchaeia archaeon]